MADGDRLTVAEKDSPLHVNDKAAEDEAVPRHIVIVGQFRRNLEFFRFGSGLIPRLREMLPALIGTIWKRRGTAMTSTSKIHDPAVSLIERGDRGRVVKGGAGYRAEQGSDYLPGISAETVGSQALWLGIVTLPPGQRTKAHVHERHETAFYMMSGDEVELWTGDGLQHCDRVQPGDYLFIPPERAPRRSQPERQAGSLYRFAQRAHCAGKRGDVSRDGWSRTVRSP